MESLNQEGFAEYLTVALSVSQQMPARQINFSREDFRLSWESEKGSHTVNLGNYFQDYSRSPNRLDEITVAITNDAHFHPETENEIKQRLYPHIVDLWTIAERKLHAQTKDSGKASTVRYPHYSLTQSLVAVLAYDLPDSRILINSMQSDVWVEDWEEVFDEALSRLIERTVPQFDRYPLPGSRTYTSVWHDGYDASRMLHVALMDSLKKEVTGYPVIFMPDASNMVVTGADDRIGLAHGLAVLNAAQKKPNSLPPIPVVWKDGCFEKLVLPPKHPLRDAFRREELLYFDRIYKAQSDLLKQSRECLQAEVFVARFVVYGDETGQNVYSSCTLTEGVLTLLPKADHIRFVRVNSENDVTLVGETSWDKFAKVMGAKLQKTDHYPPRFSVSQFPSESQLMLLLR